MRNLTKEQLKTNLSLGKPIEQWLSPKQHDSYVVLRCLTIDKNKNSTYNTHYVEYFDDGDENFVDVYDFSWVHPDEPEELNTHGSINEALNFVISTYGAASDKFVNAGMLQDEYKDHIKYR